MLRHDCVGERPGDAGQRQRLYGNVFCLYSVAYLQYIGGVAVADVEFLYGLTLGTGRSRRRELRGSGLGRILCICELGRAGADIGGGGRDHAVHVDILYVNETSKHAD